MMRILHVSEVRWGGVVNLLHHFTTAQTARGHDVHLLAPTAFPDVVQANRHDWVIDRHQPLTFGKAAQQLARLVRELDPAVIHLHSFVAGFIGRLPRVVPTEGPPVIYQPHAWSFDLFDNRTKAFFIRTWERWGNSRTAALVANCADELAEGRASGIDNDGYPIGVAIDLEHFVPPRPEQRLEAQRQLGVRGSKVIVVLGRLTRQKGQDMLLTAWERAPLQNAELILVGPGDPRYLLDFAPTQWGRTVHSVGETNDPRLWLWACDLLMLPSRYETVSLVVGEAMACGVPVVATAVNGAREAVLDGPLAAAGDVAGLGDMQALLKAAQVRLDDGAVRMKEGVHARRRAECIFDPVLVASKLESAYAATVKRHAASHSSKLR